MDILRFITAGSVDNGKSTLNGRLLHDSRSVMIDHLNALEQRGNNRTEESYDLALLTDGLRAEREHGITIDVAYKYFTTPVRKFIMVDAPGHLQFTRNMVTGASNADVVIILIDARHGLVEQTNRHALIAAMLGIPHLVVAVNKMDLVGYSRAVYEQIMIDFGTLVKSFDLSSVTFVPVSALKGDNVVDKSEHMPWYQGSTLLNLLEHIEVKTITNLDHARFPVQYVIRHKSEEFHAFRGYAGKVVSGIYRKGDPVTVLPSGFRSTIKSIQLATDEVEEAFAPQSVALQLTDPIEVNRGDVIVKHDDMPSISQELEVFVCWMDATPMLTGNDYLLQLNCAIVKAEIKQILYLINVDTLQKEYDPGQARLNDIVKCRLTTSVPIAYDPYYKLRENGAAILINESTKATVGACMIL